MWSTTHLDLLSNLGLFARDELPQRDDARRAVTELEKNVVAVNGMNAAGEMLPRSELLFGGFFDMHRIVGVRLNARFGRSRKFEVGVASPLRSAPSSSAPKSSTRGGTTTWAAGRRGGSTCCSIWGAVAGDAIDSSGSWTAVAAASTSLSRVATGGSLSDV